MSTNTDMRWQKDFDDQEGQYEGSSGSSPAGSELDMVETGFGCDTCWYYYADSEENLKLHKLQKHQSGRLLCEWPACHATFLDDHAVQTHIRHEHYRLSHATL